MAGAGAAGWFLGGGSDSTPAPKADPAAARAARAAAAEAETATAAEQARVEWLRSADGTIQTLGSRRAADRRRLAAATTPADQAARGRRLARSYEIARGALGDAPESVAGAAAVRSALRRAQGAYERLARSAGNENRSAYQRAVASVRASEADLTRALARLGQPS